MASSGCDGASARALKQWSQLHTLSIQCFDISTVSRVTKPRGRTVADQSTYAASAAPGCSARQGATPSANAANSAARAATTSSKRCVGRERGRLRRHLLDRDLPLAPVAADLDRPLPRAKALGADHRELAGERGDAIAAAGLVGGEHGGPVLRRDEEERARERGQSARGIRKSQAEPGTAHSYGVDVGERGRELAAAADPAKSLGRGELGRLDWRAARHRLEGEHGVQAGLMRDEVDELGRAVQPDHTRHRQPGAAHAERHLVDGEVEGRHQSLTAPAVTPAATYRWATTSSTAAGIDATTAVAMMAFQSWVLLPMYL